MEGMPSEETCKQQRVPEEERRKTGQEKEQGRDGFRKSLAHT